MIVDSLKIMKKKYEKACKKKYKGEIEILGKAIKKINKLEEEIKFYEQKKQETLFDSIDKGVSN